MSFGRRLYFYLIGAILGSILSVLLFGPERFGCSGYLPNGRVLAELKTKHWQIDSTQLAKLSSLGYTKDDIKDSLLNDARINFEESQARLKPCGKYMIYFPAENSKFKMKVSKCDSTASIDTIYTNL